MPAIAFGAIYLSMFTQKNGFIPPLYGTFTLLVLIGSVKYLPFASRAGVNAMLQLSNEIEEAAVIQGVSWWKRMVKIIFPIQKTSFLSGYLLPFISCMREPVSYTHLTSPPVPTIPSYRFRTAGGICPWHMNVPFRRHDPSKYFPTFPRIFEKYSLLPPNPAVPNKNTSFPIIPLRNPAISSSQDHLSTKNPANTTSA